MADEEEAVPKVSVHLDWRSRTRSQQFQEISVYGSWNRFLEATTLEYQGGGTFAVDLDLPIGDHHYRFLVDDDWKTDDSKPKTVQHGEEFNTISVRSPDDDDDDEDDVAPGSAVDGGSMIYDAVHQSFRIGKGNKNDRRRRGRPSMEISLPNNYFTAVNKAGTLDDIAEDDARGKRRKKKKKKKKNKGAMDISSSSELAQAFKQKEEEWARMCFVQQLKQQQQHNDEIQRVKTLWKQERQVRVEMHKKVVAAKADLEKKLANTETELERLQSMSQVNASTQEKKLKQLMEERDAAEAEKVELRKQKSELEDDLRKLRHEKSSAATKQQENDASRMAELNQLRQEVATKKATIDGLQGQLEALNQNMVQIQEMHKRTLKIESSRYENAQKAFQEEKVDRIKLKEENADLQRQLMNAEREAQRMEDKKTMVESKLQQKEQDVEVLKEKMESMKTDLKKAEAEAADTSRVQDAMEKVRVEMEADKSKLQSKIDSLQSHLDTQKKDYDAQIEQMRSQHEDTVNTLSNANDVQAAAQIAEMNKRLGDKEDQLAEAKESIANSQQQLSSVQADYQQAQVQLKQAEVQEKALEDKVQMLQEEKQRLLADIEKASDHTTAQEQAANAVRLEYDSKIQVLQTQLDNQKKDTQSAMEKVDAAQEETNKMTAKNEQLEQELNTLRTDLSKMNEDSSSFEQELNKTKKALEAETKKCTDMSLQVQQLEAEFEEREQELLTKLREAEEDVDRLTEQANNRVHELEAKQEELLNELSSKQQMFADVEDRLQKMEAEMRIAKDSWEREKESLQSRLTMAESRDERIMSACKNMFTEFQTVRSTLDSIRSEKVEMVEKMNDFFPNIQQILTKAFGFNQKLVSEVTDKYKREMSLRRKYFNQLQELRGNIRVFCRVRPLLPFELKKGYRSCITFPEEGQLIVHQANKKSDDIIEHFFEFDQVYKVGTSQEAACEDTTEYIQSVMDGYNVSIFAYGQTGSGKTFTMMGPAENPGVNRRALAALFKMVDQREGMYDYNIMLSIFEIYNNEPRDLLDNNAAKGKKYSVKSGKDGSVFIDGLVEHEVSNMDEVLNAMTIADKNRTSAKTEMNEHSSRSHMLLSVFVRGFNKPANIEYRGRLYLVDLAGSERVGKSGATGATLKEAQHINKSLSALGDVMAALQNKQKFIPFRNSKLTYLMQNSLGGHAKTIMFINVCPTNEHCVETLSSLKFAKRVSKVELGKAEADVTKKNAVDRSKGPRRAKKKKK